MARPKKDVPRGTIEPQDEMIKRIRILQDYMHYIVIIDVSDIIPFEAFRTLDTIYAKMGLVIKRNFGFIGFSWGYGAIKDVRRGESYAIQEAPISLHIYFAEPIIFEFVEKNIAKFAQILAYIRKEWIIYRGDDEKAYEEVIDARD